MNEFSIEWIKGAEYAGVTVPSGMALKSKLLGLAEHNPNEVKIIAENKDGSLFVHVPVNYIRISPPRQISYEQREAASERFRQMWKDRQGGDKQEKCKMSWWTYINETITLSPMGRTQAEKRYILDTVLNHLPLVTGSERNMDVYVIQKNGKSSSCSCDEFGKVTNNLVDNYGYQGRDGRMFEDPSWCRSNNSGKPN